MVEWPCFRSKNWVPSTQYPVPSTQYPVPSTQYPVPSTQYPVPSTQYPVPSTQYPVPGPMEGSKTAVACDTMSWEGGIPACAAGATVRYFYCFGVSFFLTLRWVLRAPPVKWWGVKCASTQTCPTFILYFSFRSQVLTIFCTQNLKMACKN